MSAPIRKPSHPSSHATINEGPVTLSAPAPHYHRRRFLQLLTLGVAISPLATLFGCGGASSEAAASAGSATSTAGGTSTGGSTSTGSSSSWARGGTAAMTANFPADSLFASSSSCSVSLTKALTEGPCYFAVTTQDDISQSQIGLPMQLCLRVVNSQCQPLAGLEVEVWHCNVSGHYSGDTSGSTDAQRFAGSFCTGNDSAASKAKWFRGILVTDSNGRVNFKSCFPGWYSGRTIHIHFRVRRNTLDQVISQCCFSDSLTEDICRNHPEYSSHGVQDTPLSGGRDTVFGSSASTFLFDTARNDDGSLLVWKTIMLSNG